MKKSFYSFLFLFIVFLTSFFIIELNQIASLETKDFIDGVFFGLFILVTLYVLEFSIFSYQWFRILFYFINSLLYLSLLCILFLGIFFLLYSPDLLISFSSPVFLGIISALLFGLFFQFSMAMFELIGSEGFIYALTRIYRKPKQEERIFLSIDLANSTSLAHKLGEEKYISFVNAFFEDVSAVIEEYEGKIYKYVGDEVIITWRFRQGIKDAKCIYAIQKIMRVFDEKKKWYKEHFKTIPYFRSGMHIGSVMVGVIGAKRKEVAYIGSILNVTSRIQGACKELNHVFLCSKTLVDLISVKEDITFCFVEKKKLRGVSRMMSLYTIE